MRRCWRFACNVVRNVSSAAAGRRSLVSTTMGDSEVPSTLKALGHGFNKHGQLRQLNKDGEITDKPFEFQVSPSHIKNQERYEAIGDVITEVVYSLLIAEGLQRLPVPAAATKEEGTFVFATSDMLTNKETLLVLIHGSGVVRAGQWARSLIINDGLKSGTQLSYIEEARRLGYSVLVLNSNDNRRRGPDMKSVKVKGSEDPVAHAVTVWRDYVSKAAAKQVFIVAHSYGGVVTLALAQTFLEDFQSRVAGVAFTDSVHDLTRDKVSPSVKEFLTKVGRNWVASDLPLDTAVSKSSEGDIPMVSAGHKKHEMTSYCSMASIFKFFNKSTASAPQEKQEL